MKRVEIEKLKEEASEKKGARRAHILKVLFESGYKDLGFYEKFKDDKNAAVKAVLKRILKEHGEEEGNFSNLEKIKKTLENTTKKEKRLEIYKEAINLDEKIKKEILLLGLNDPSWDIRDFISNLIAKDESFTNEDIYKLVENPLWSIRREGVKILGIRGDEKVFEYKDKFLSDTNTDIKITYIEAVERVGGKKAISVIYKFKKDENQWVKKRAEKAINDLLKEKN